MTTDRKPIPVAPTPSLGTLLKTILANFQNEKFQENLQLISDLEFYTNLLKKPSFYDKFVREIPKEKISEYSKLISTIDKQANAHIIKSDEELIHSSKRIAQLCAQIKGKIESSTSVIKKPSSGFFEAKIGKIGFPNKFAGNAHEDLHSFMSLDEKPKAR